MGTAWYNRSLAFSQKLYVAYNPTKSGKQSNLFLARSQIFVLSCQLVVSRCHGKLMIAQTHLGPPFPHVLINLFLQKEHHLSVGIISFPQRGRMWPLSLIFFIYFLFLGWFIHPLALSLSFGWVITHDSTPCAIHPIQTLCTLRICMILPCWDYFLQRCGLFCWVQSSCTCHRLIQRF